MKKKVFSKLLMVALVATVGAFTSCKDYDDDINDLRSQINGLETSLTTAIDQKTTSVANQVTLLEQQLEKVKADYAAADQALDTQLKALQNADVTLQGGIDANKAKIEGNLQAINDLKTEVANLYATKASLEAAKTALENSLKEANALIKSHGETIATLVATDQTLEKGISEAKANAAKAQETADAAKAAAEKVAGDLSTQVTKEATDVANLQKQISDNLASLTKKIDDMNTALDARINANATSIATLRDDVSKNYATVVSVNALIDEVKKANQKVADELNQAKTDLQKAITDGDKAGADALAAAEKAMAKAIKDGDDALSAALDAAKETLAKAIKDGDDAQAAALTQSQLELAAQIQVVADKAEATATALALLEQKEAADIQALSDKHDSELDAFIEEVTKHIVPATVAYQIPLAMTKFFNETIKPYVDGVDEKHTTLLNNFIERFEADSIKLDAYLAGEYLLAIQALVGDTADVLRDEMAATAYDLQQAYEAADLAINNAIKDMKDETVEGSLANLLKNAKENLQGQINKMNDVNEAGSLAWHINNIETFIGTNEDGSLSIDKLAESIAATKTFGEALTKAVKEEMGEVLSMITSINLYANQHQAQDNDGGFDGFDHTLVFTYIVEKADVKFPAAEGITDAQIDFTDGMFRSFSDSILVRVSPTNAVLTKDKIALLNSQGENIVANKVIEVTEVSPYVREEGQYITRAAENTGLWVIKFKINERQIGEDFKNAAYTKDNKSILYAVAAKNAEAAEGNRYVISEYDLDLATADAYPGWDFDVNGVGIADIHNRYIETDMEFVKTDINEGVQKKTYKKELTWIGYGEAGKAAQPYADAKYYKVGDGTPEFKAYKAGIPAVTVITEGENANATDRFGHTTQDELNGIDNRHKKEMLDVDVEQEIKISFPDYYDGDINYPILVKGFYVTLDQEFALESYPSEYNQWTNYTYENVGYTKIVSPTETEVVKAKLFERKDGKTEGTIKIKNLGNVKGDVIGFRVYAVNVDGTLYDPDGRAFYVRVGYPYLTRDLAFNVFAETPANSGAIQTGDPIVAQNAKFDADKTNTEDPFFNVDPDYLQNYNFVLTWGKNNPKVLVGANRPRLAEVAEGETGYYGNTDADLISELFDFQCTPANPAKYGEGEWDETFKPNYKTSNVSVRLKAANRLINDTTYNLVLTIYKRNNNNADPNLNSGSSIIEKVNIKVKKSMPDYLPEAFGVRFGQENEAADMKFYLRPLTRTITRWNGFIPVFSQTYTQESWSLNSWFDNTNADEKWGASKIDEGNSTYPYRWATDVRPYNFEEIFTGIVDDNENYDENYQFVFEGCGDVMTDDAEADAISTFRKYGTVMNYTGLNKAKQETTMKPAYYLPFVHYGVLNTYGATALPVKASYVYRGVSLEVEDDEIVPGVDYVSEPIWFDANGHKVDDPAKAAFKAKFACAIENAFNLSVTAPDVATSTDARGANPSSGKPIGSKENYINYGYDFSVTNGGTYTAELSWKSNLAAYPRSSATGASYFKTNFKQFTTTFDTEASGTKCLYYAGGKDNDKMTANINNATAGYADVFRTGNRFAENWLKLVDVKLEGKQLKVTKVVLYQPGVGVDDTKIEKTFEGDAALKKLGNYFTIEEVANNGLSFKFHGNSLAPNDLGIFKITLATGSISGKILHQWGHITNEKTASKSIDVYYGYPDSDPNIQHARQAR